MRLMLLVTLCALVPPSLHAAPPKFDSVKLVKAEDDGSPYVKLPAEIKADINDFVVIKPDTNGSEVQYYLVDKGGVALFPSEELKNPKNAVVIVKAAGRYRILAYTAAKDKASPPAIVTIVAGNAPPPDPSPGPSPGPGPAPNPGPRPAGFAGECYDKMAAIPKAEVAIVAGAIKRVLSDKVNHPVAYPKIREIMKANMLPQANWTPYMDWYRTRLQAIYEADGTDATTAEVVEGLTAWQVAAEALVK